MRPAFTSRNKTFRLFGLLLLPLALHAQEDNVGAVDLAQCFYMVDVNERVACYDNLARIQLAEKNPAAAGRVVEPEMPAAAPAPPLAARQAEPAVATITRSEPVVATTPAAPAVTNVEEFGQQATVRVDEAGDAVLTDRISSLRRVEPTKWQITLASGQVWKQTVGKQFVLREDDTITIARSSWGNSYRLSVAGRPGYIQVSRLH